MNEPVDLRFPLPGVLVTGEEDLDGDAFPVPDASPNFPVSTSADTLAQRYLPGKRPLDQQRQSTTRSGCDRVLQVFL